MAEQTTIPRRSRARVFRHALLRGESIVATGGLFTAAILVIALGAAAWWSVHTYKHAVEIASESRTRSVAQLVGRNSAALLADDNLAGLQRLIDETIRQHGFTICRVIVPGLSGRVIADGSGAAVSLGEELPETWPGAGLAAEAPEVCTRRPDGTLDVRIPIAVPGRGLAELRIEDVQQATTADAWAVQAGIGAIGAMAMAALWLAYRAMRRRLRALGAIGEALKDAGNQDASTGDLLVNASLGAEAAAWNRLLAERERLRDQVAGARAADRLSGRRSRDGELGSVCDGLWLGLLLVDEQMRVKYVNGAATVFLKSRREDLQNADLRKLLDEPKVLESVREVAAGVIRNRIVTEIRRAGENGGSVLRFTVRPLRKEDSATALVVIEDVTQQRVADEARNHFVAQATHELRTPLTNIRLYVEMLVDGGAVEDPKKRSDALNVISQEVRRLERIVGDMLSVAEIEAGSLKLNRDDVRINTVFEELAADFREQAAGKEIKLRFDLPPKLPVLRGDRDKIVMALHNLVGNAIKYTPAGGEVGVRVAEEKGNLVIDVVDNGIGIRDDEKELIFEKFYRAKDKRIANITGTGLGLAIAREVVRLHGGDITLRTQIDKGSTFTMTLPAAA